MTYPTPEQYDGWKEEASELDMSVSEWIQAMVEAGRKKFNARVEPDESAKELREQRNDLKEELTHARDRIAKLEQRIHHSERREIIDHVENNPGATYGEIGQRLSDTVPDRLRPHLDALEGTELSVIDDGEKERFYPAGGDS